MEKKTRLYFTLSKHKKLAKAVCKYGTFIITIKQTEDGLLLTPYFKAKKK